MKHDWHFCAGAGNYLNAGQDNEMREPGLEPGSLTTPDPKSHRTPELTPTAEPNLAPAATEIPPDDTPGTTPNATCGVWLAACQCARPKGHEGAHVCRCKGAWTGSEATGDLNVVRFPEVRDDGSPNYVGIALNAGLEPLEEQA